MNRGLRKAFLHFDLIIGFIFNRTSNHNIKAKGNIILYEVLELLSGVKLQGSCILNLSLNKIRHFNERQHWVGIFSVKRPGSFSLLDSQLRNIDFNIFKTSGFKKDTVHISLLLQSSKKIRGIKTARIRLR